MMMSGSQLQVVNQQPQPQKLLDRVRLALPARHDSRRTGEVYAQSRRRFVVRRTIACYTET